MLKKEFKTLMHINVYADYNNLHKGIYSYEKPFIFDKDQTIESLINQAKMIKDMTGATFITEEYIINLKRCKLVDIVIKL